MSQYRKRFPYYRCPYCGKVFVDNLKYPNHLLYEMRAAKILVRFNPEEDCHERDIDQSPDKDQSRGE